MVFQGTEIPVCLQTYNFIDHIIALSFNNELIVINILLRNNNFTAMVNQSDRWRERHCLIFPVNYFKIVKAGGSINLIESFLI